MDLQENSIVPRISGENKLSNDRGLRMRMRGEERRISSQHKQLGDLFERVLDSVESGGPRTAIGDLLLFSTALEAHMAVEEDIYFPALHGMRNDVGEELVGLVAQHNLIRGQLTEVREQLKTGDDDGGRQALDDLANFVGRHEHEEEDLIARISEGPLSSFSQPTLEGGG
jgi:hypothetical protein